MINTINVTKQFGNFTALKDLTCTIPDGCIYGMVGSNGAGKSTFLRLLSGVYKPDSGSVLMDGSAIYENPNTKQYISFVPDELFFLPGYSIKKMAEFYSNCFKTFDEKKFKTLSATFNLPEKKAINSFSKGMKRQAAITLALACNPRYIFFDETFDGLDPIIRNTVKSIIYDEVASRKATAIITSHSLRELEDACDQLAFIHKGGLVLESEVDNLKTSLFKVQVSLADDFDKDTFKNLEILSFTKKGSVASLIVKGNKDEAISYIKTFNPLLLDTLSLSLEEVFTYELANFGYSFNDFMEAYNDEKQSI